MISPKTACFDLETNGLLLEATKIHCIAIFDMNTRTNTLYGGSPELVEQGLQKLAGYRTLIGHNIGRFDIPVIEKLHPHIDLSDKDVRDTLLISQMICPDIEGGHSLDAWGKRLNEFKGTYEGLPREYNLNHLRVAMAALETYRYKKGFITEHEDSGRVITGQRLSFLVSHKPANWVEELHHYYDYIKSLIWKSEHLWDDFSEAMGEYCLQDTVVCRALYGHLISILKAEGVESGFWEGPYKTEIDIVPILNRQYIRGIDFDVAKAEELRAKLLKAQEDIDEQLKGCFGLAVVPGEETTPKANRGAYTRDVPYCKLTIQEFNPGSRQQIQERFFKKYGWTSKKFTEKGNSILDQAVLEDLPYPEAKLLYDRLELGKRLGQLSDGSVAWMKLLDKNNRIHGDFHQVGTVTRRFTHMRPNMSQVPANDKPFGKECRELFCAPEGYVMVGIDAAQIEMRGLAGYIKRYDSGSFEYDVLQGDAHQTNADILGCERQLAKGWFYAFIYGAGNEKLQKLVPGSKKSTFEAGLNGFKQLKDQLLSTLKNRGYLMSIDGCPLRIRGEHVALNTLLQSFGSILMKKALKIFDDRLAKEGLNHGIDYEFVNNIHDEWQLIVRPEYAELVGRTGVEAIREAGRVLRFPTPMDGEYKIGLDWSCTH